MRALLTLFMLSLLISPVLASGKKASDTSSVKSPKIMVLKFHADWCGSCKTMGSVMTDLSNKFDGKSVLFATFDRTNNTTSHRSELLASAMNLGKVYQENAGTGYILVVNKDSGQVLHKLTKAQSGKEMGKVIATALN